MGTFKVEQFFVPPLPLFLIYIVLFHLLLYFVPPKDPCDWRKGARFAHIICRGNTEGWLWEGSAIYPLISKVQVFFQVHFIVLFYFCFKGKRWWFLCRLLQRRNGGKWVPFSCSPQQQQALLLCWGNTTQLFSTIMNRFTSLRHRVLYVPLQVFLFLASLSFFFIFILFIIFLLLLYPTFIF